MDNKLALVDFETMQRMSVALFESGYFPDVKSKAQAIAKVMAGAEMGIKPFASMSGIHIINGMPSPSANLTATLVKNDPRYDYRVTHADDTLCTLSWYENGNFVGKSSFGMGEAKAANLTGKSVWKQYPSDMLFARAVTRGARRFAPGIFGGAPVYTPEELGVDIAQADYEIVEVTQDPPSNNTGPDAEPEPTLAEANDMLYGKVEQPEAPPRKSEEPKFNGNVEDARAWLDDKGTCTLGIVADALVMTGLYGDRKHVANALNGADGQALRDAGLQVDMRRNVKATLKIFDWAISRKMEANK